MFTVANLDRIEPGSALAADVARIWMEVANNGARDGTALVGWVSIRINDSPLTAHWAKLEQLILAARGGEHLEPFYERHGWSEIGRHVGSLRFADNDRDEILMRLRLAP